MQDKSNPADTNVFACLSSPRLWVLPTVLTVLLVIVAQFNYLGFHTIAEVFAIIIAAMLFSFAWMTFSYSKDGYSLILGCGYLFVGGLDLFHLFVFEGISVLVPGNINQAAEFWIAARGLEASVLLFTPFVVRAAPRKYMLLIFTGCVFLIAVGLIFGGVIPDAYVEGSGLTAFKVVSEYIIISMLMAAFWVTCFRQKFLSKEQRVIIGSAILMTILGELCFTLFTSIEDLPFMAGHLLKIYSFWFIFSAVVIIGLDEPYLRLANSHKNFKAHYDSSPVSIWSEDFTGLLKEFDRLRRTGTEDLRSHLSENASEIDRLSGLIKVDDVNAATLELFEVDQDKDSLSRISLCFNEGARNIFANELCALWDGEANFQAKTTLRTLKNNDIIVIISLPLPQNLEDSASVPVTITDITSQESALRDTQKAQDIMLKSSLSVISAVSATVEKRDPYTAGHQNKVANLCVSIAEELGWDSFRTEGLRLGSMIHDIGKISVPAEILNRPGKLSEVQLAMVRSHPQVGADILLHTEFPWPIQQMILQHHERLDGTGYPQGLSGDEIIDEAKIIAVADVMEAMTSHRPYRPALGIELALEEISRGRGSTYDPDVVDACIKIVSADGFEWSDAVATSS